MTEPTDEAQAARRAALLLLGRRDFGAHELRLKLAARGHSSAAIDAALEGLIAARLLDDGRFLENYIRVHAGRGQGPTRLRQALQQLGFATEPIEQALAAGPDFAALCGEVRVRKFGRQLPRSWSEKGKQARFLQYRGFSADHIRLAISQDPDTPESIEDDHD